MYYRRQNTLILCCVVLFSVVACNSREASEQTLLPDFTQISPTLLVSDGLHESTSGYLPLIFNNYSISLAVDPILETATLSPTNLATSTEGTCVIQQPPGWVSYQVSQGDTLFNLAQTRSVSIEELKEVNCRESDVIIQGEFLYVPPLTTQPTQEQSPLPSTTEPPKTTPTLTSQPTPSTPTFTLLPTSTHSPTSTPSPIPTTPVSPPPSQGQSTANPLSLNQ